MGKCSELVIKNANGATAVSDTSKH